MLDLYFAMQDLNREAIKHIACAISVSGRDYTAADRTIQENDMITIDLSPQKDNIWGGLCKDACDRRRQGMRQNRRNKK